MERNLFVFIALLAVTAAGAILGAIGQKYGPMGAFGVFAAGAWIGMIATRPVGDTHEPL